MKIKTTVRGGLQAVTSVYGGRGCGGGGIYPIRQTYLVP
jgi:hypothetical protein